LLVSRDTSPLHDKVTKRQHRRAVMMAAVLYGSLSLDMLKLILSVLPHGNQHCHGSSAAGTLHLLSDGPA